MRPIFNWEKLDLLKGKLGYQGALVAVAGLVTSGALALASKVTGPEIEAAAARDLQQSLSQVLTSEHDNDLIKDSVRMTGPGGNEITVYKARHLGRVEAVVFQVTGTGYGGPIVCVMGVGRDGKVQGVRVIKHTETPGLGDKIELAKDGWIHAFEGRFLGDPPPEKFAVKKDGGVFDQFAGATITPRGVVKAVKGGLEFFGREKAALLDEADESATRKAGDGAARTEPGP